MEGLTENLIKISKDVNSLLNSPQIKTFAKTVAEIQASIDEKLKAVQPVIQQLGLGLKKAVPCIKYFLIEDSEFYISDTAFFDALNLEYPFTTEKDILLNFIEEFYCNNNCEELVRLFEEWNEYKFIKDRLEILNSCKLAFSSKLHIEDIANIVIPILIAHIDGMTKDFYITLEPKLKEKKTLKHHVIITKNERWNELPYAESMSFINVIHYLFYFDQGIKNGKDNEGKDKYFIDKATDEKLEHYVLNRNGIMHGSILDYGKKIELIRIILFFDAVLKSLNSLIETIKLENES